MASFFFPALRRYADRFPFYKRFIKFCVVGGMAAIISFVVLFIATECLKIWYVASAILSFVVSAGFNFCINKAWTFRNKAAGAAAYGQLVKFFAVYIAGLVINTLLIYSLTEFVGFDYRWSWFFATGAVTFWNFGFTQFWTFRER